MMLVRCLASLTSTSMSTSKKSDWRWCMRRLTMLPPASPMMVQTWPSTPGALRMVARQAGAGDGVALGLRRPLQVAPDAPRRSSNSASVCAVDGVDGQALASGSRMPTMRSPGTGEQQSPKWMRDAGRQAAAAHEEPGALAVLDAAGGAVAAFALGPSGPGTRSPAPGPARRGRGRRPRTARPRWRRRSGPAPAAARRPCAILPAALEGLVEVARPRRVNSSFSVWRMWRRMAERARPVTVSERQSGGTSRLGAADHLDHVAVLQRRAQRLQLAVDLHARRWCRRRRCGRRRRSRAAWPPRGRLISRPLGVKTKTWSRNISSLACSTSSSASPPCSSTWTRWRRFDQRVAAAVGLHAPRRRSRRTGSCSASGRRRPPRPPGPWPRCGSASRCACPWARPPWCAASGSCCAWASR